MSSPTPTSPGSKATFWRSLRFLGPHRKIVIVSILCAFVVGAAFTSGLGAMMPILQVLIKGDPVAVWMNRQIVERRLDFKLIDDPDSVRIARVGDRATELGLLAEDTINGVDGITGTDAILARLSDPNQSTATIERVVGADIPVNLQPVPWYLQNARSIAGQFPADPIWAIAAVFAIVAGLASFGNVVRYFQEYLSDKAAILAVNDIRRKLYDHVLHMPLSYFALTGTSDITSRLSQDAQSLMDGFKTVLGKSIQEPIKAAMSFGLALYLSWQLTLFIVLFAPIMFVLIKKFGTKMRRASRKAMQSSAVMLGQLEGTLGGIRVVKSANAERFERRRYTGIMQSLVNESLRMSRIDAASAPILETLTMFVAGAIVLYAAHLVLNVKALNETTFILVMIALLGIGESLRKCSKINNQIQKANAAAMRIFEIMEVPVERPRKSDISSGEQVKRLKKLPTISRDVRFENVTFYYPNSTTPAVSDVTLHVPKGKCIAVVGRNGSGKTTLMALLPRFYDPQQGSVMIDGVDVRTVTLRSLRKQISVVTQDSVIFPGTIASNIAYGNPRASREQIENAAKRAFAHEFILEKPQGYDTILGEMGGQLSGGQRQRINIARAILRAAPILILDEATSQVDAESEHLIQKAVESLVHERTTFIIAHRFSTILSADTIIVMDRGQIVGQGKHEELLRTCETYVQLYERQLVAPVAVSA